MGNMLIRMLLFGGGDIHINFILLFSLKSLLRGTYWWLWLWIVESILGNITYLCGRSISCPFLYDSQLVY